MAGDNESIHEDAALHAALEAFDRLDAALAQAEPSRIELCLAKVPRAYRPALLSWLLPLELAGRRGRGESPVESEYIERFPAHTLIVRAAFHGTVRTPESAAFAQTAGPPVPTRSFLSPSSHDDGYTVAQTPRDSSGTDGPTRSHHDDSLAGSGFWSFERRLRYSLSHFYKAGGLGEIWRARDHQFGREVALKRIKEDRVTHAPTRARFLREAWITGQLQHPGIVPVFELGSLPGVEEPFYTMRFVEGPTLSAAVAEYHSRRKERATGPLELRRLLGSFVSACQVVAYAHSRGVIHRDLKGQNIVLGDFGEVIVLDWGLAKVMADTPSKSSAGATEAAATFVSPPSGSWDETIDGSVLGTPAYMSPEQALGRIEQLDERSDVYGMGAILYEVLTGVPPFRGEPAEVLRKVTDLLPDFPRQVLPDVPRALEAICMKCLAKDPRGRYPNAIALAEDIQRFLAGEPVSAHRESWRDKTRRWASRHRTLVTTTIATLLGATACLAAATALLRIANAREAAARTQAEQRLSLTLRATDRFFTRVADAPSLKVFGLEKFEKDVLSEAESILKELLDDQTRASDVSADHGRCCLRLSVITGTLGDTESAVRFANEARTTFARLLSERPDRRLEHQHGLAESLDALGVAYEGIFQLREAEKTHKAAAAAWETLATNPQEAPEPSHRLVASLNRRARLACLKLGDTPVAQQIIAMARERSDALLEKHPGVAEYVREHAKAYVLAGVALTFSSPGSTEQATILFDEALARLERIAADQPLSTEAQADLVDACALIASSYSNAGLEGRAKTTSDHVRTVARRLVREHPDVPVFAENNALVESLDAMRLARAGHHLRAAAALDEALKGVGNSGLARMFAACCLSVASEVVSADSALTGAQRAALVERYQARAVELLREAKKTGLFYQPLQLAGVKGSDDDLKALRNRADFQAFLSELESSSTLVPASGKDQGPSPTEPAAPR